MIFACEQNVPLSSIIQLAMVIFNFKCYGSFENEINFKAKLYCLEPKYNPSVNFSKESRQHMSVYLFLMKVREESDEEPIYTPEAH